MEDKRTEQYRQELKEFVMSHTEDVLKNPRSFIRYPFIDPGSVYDGNVWDWDTYWSVYGFLNLADSYQDPSVKPRIIEHAQGNIRNFFDHQLEDGYIPMMIEVADWPEPYLNMRHKEGKIMNMHKPFLCSQMCLISDYTGDYAWTEEFLSGVAKYFECYDHYYFHENSGLYVWQDDIMIGMIGAIQQECWDKRDRFFYSVDVDIKTRKYDWFHQGLGVFWKTLPIKVRVWSGFIPMYVGIVTKEQAADMVKHIFDPATFGSDFGLTTLSKDEKMFDLSVTNNPSNWLGPIWLVANYVVFRGLLNYGYRMEAEIMYKRTMRLLGEDLAKTGCLHEYYNPFNGEPVMNGGFINWNILALNMADELEGKKPMCLPELLEKQAEKQSL